MYFSQKMQCRVGQNLLEDIQAEPLTESYARFWCQVELT
jgi:hypothetical protein